VCLTTSDSVYRAHHCSRSFLIKLENTCAYNHDSIDFGFAVKVMASGAECASVCAHLEGASGASRLALDHRGASCPAPVSLDTPHACENQRTVPDDERARTKAHEATNMGGKLVACCSSGDPARSRSAFHQKTQLSALDREHLVLAVADSRCAAAFVTLFEVVRDRNRDAER
jgi:hypothetical protein